MRRRPAWSRRRDAHCDRRAGDVGVLAAGAAGLRLLGAGAHRAATFPIAKRSRLGSQRDRLTSPKVHSSTPKTAVEEQRRQVGRRVERRVVLLRPNADADTIDPLCLRVLGHRDGCRHEPGRDARGEGQGSRASRSALRSEAARERTGVHAICVTVGWASLRCTGRKPEADRPACRSSVDGRSALCDHDLAAFGQCRGRLANVWHEVLERHPVRQRAGDLRRADGLPGSSRRDRRRNLPLDPLPPPGPALAEGDLRGVHSGAGRALRRDIAATPGGADGASRRHELVDQLLPAMFRERGVRRTPSAPIDHDVMTVGSAVRRRGQPQLAEARRALISLRASATASR